MSMEREKPVILIADDDGTTRMSLRRVLESDGYAVIEACDGLEALSACEQFSPDIVLLDIMMPKVDGLAVCARLRQMKKCERTHVLMITILDDETSVEKTFAAGTNDFISKPINLSVLHHRVSHLLKASRAEKAQRASHQQLLDIIEFLPDATFVINQDQHVIAWNHALEEMTGVSKEEILGKGDYAYAVPFYGDSRPMLLDLIFTEEREHQQQYENFERKGTMIYAEVFLPTILNGTGAFVWKKASPLFDSEGNITGAIESIRNITERKNMEERLRYLSFHDQLTGLYNRTYFEEEIRRMEDGRHNHVGIVLCDVDGLKLINDTLGHDSGDSLLVATANLIKISFREGDMVARIGGDEFAVLLPNCSEKIIQKIRIRIQDTVAKHNTSNPELPLSISIGFAIKRDPTTMISDLFKEADNNMYREKLDHRQSVGSTIVRTIMKALESKDFITGGHAGRLRKFVIDLAVAVGLPEQDMPDLCLLAKFHNIGKVAVTDSILFKPGPLSPDETTEMRRHSEIGHRIAQSSRDLTSIADWILKHHSWWNGDGYPLDLKGEDIPIECRILAIADAYDAMTSDRPYRQTMSRNDAVAELRRCAGIQFDPQLVEKIILILEGQSA